MAINAGTVAAALTLDTGQFEGALASSRKMIDSFGDQTKTLDDKLKIVGQTMTGVGTAMTLTVTSSTIAAGAAATKTFMTFDDAMRQVRATMSATEADTLRLTEAAKHYGATTSFSSAQAAEALNYLALAGYDADRAIAALPVTLQLAQAGNIDLARASDMVTDSMAALGLSMGQLEQFTDQMARTSQKSNTSVAQLGEAILTVGGTAKSLAGGTVELNALLGILADNGIKAAEGGTHLRNVILALQAPTDEARKLLDQYTNGVYDAEGRMRSLDGILQDLNRSFASMTDEQKQNIIAKIFNVTDLGAVQALLSGCGDRFAELSAQIEHSAGTSAKMAETMEGGIGGSMRNLQSAAEAVAIEFGETLAPTVQKGAEALSGAATALAGMDEGMKSVVVHSASAAAALGPLLVVGGKLLPMLTGIGTALATTPIGWIAGGAAAIALLVNWAKQGSEAMQSLNRELQRTNEEGVSEFMQGAQKLTQDVEVSVDVDVKRDYAGEASTIYADIFAWLTDGMPDTAEQKQQVKAQIQGYYDDLLSEINLNESEQMDKLNEQYEAGFISYDTYLARTEQVRASAATARTELGALCDESIAFVESYAGQPAAVVGEAYGEIEELERRAGELLVSVGLVNEEMSQQADRAVQTTKAGLAAGPETYGMAFGHVNQQYEEDLAAIQAEAEELIAQAEQQWAEVRAAAESPEQIQTADDALVQKREQIAADEKAKIAALQQDYLAEFDLLFAGIAKQFPEEVERLKELHIGSLTLDDLTDEMIAAMGDEGIDVDRLVEAAMGDPYALDEAMKGALRVIAQGSNLDLAEEAKQLLKFGEIDAVQLMTDLLSGTDFGAAVQGVIEAGYLDGIEGIDTDTLEGKLAMITGTLSASMDGTTAGSTYAQGVAQGIADNSTQITDASGVAGENASAAMTDAGISRSGGTKQGRAYVNAIAASMRAGGTSVRAAAQYLARMAKVNMPNTGGSGGSDAVSRAQIAQVPVFEAAQASMVRLNLAPSRTQPSPSGASSAQPQAQAGVHYNISIENAQIRSEDEAKQLLKTATQYTRSINRGVGRG